MKKTNTTHKYGAKESQHNLGYGPCRSMPSPPPPSKERRRATDKDGTERVCSFSECTQCSKLFSDCRRGSGQPCWSTRDIMRELHSPCLTCNSKHHAIASDDRVAR
ncbi:unnamed protein product, partial [Ectocarpus sp. 12 AP-2014]